MTIVGAASGMRVARRFPGAPHPNSTDYVNDPKPTFSPDGLIGGRLEGGVRQAQIAFQGIQLQPKQPLEEALYWLTGNEQFSGEERAKGTQRECLAERSEPRGAREFLRRGGVAESR